MGEISRRQAIGYSAGGVVGLGVLLSDTARDLAYRTIDAFLRPSAAFAQEPNKFDALYGEKRRFKDAKEELGYLVQNFYMKPTLEVADATLGKIESLVKQNPNVKKRDSRSHPIGTQELYNAGLKAQTKEKNYAKALSYYQKALGLGDTDPSIHKQMAGCYFKLKEPKKELQHMIIAAKSEPGDGKYHRGLGMVQFDLGMNIEAYFELRLGLILDPKYKKKTEIESLIQKSIGKINSD